MRQWRCRAVPAQRHSTARRETTDRRHATTQPVRPVNDLIQMCFCDREQQNIVIARARGLDRRRTVGWPERAKFRRNRDVVEVDRHRKAARGGHARRIDQQPVRNVHHRVHQWRDGLPQIDLRPGASIGGNERFGARMTCLAQRKSGARIDGIYLAQSGAHLDGFYHEGSVNVSSADNLVGRVSESRNIHPEVDCGIDSGVSRRQSRLSTDGTRWYVEDLGSANGTFVGPAAGPLPVSPITGRYELGPDDRVYVGAWTRIVVRKASKEEIDSLG